MTVRKMYEGFDQLISDLGPNAPKNDGEREIFRRVFIRGYENGWQDAENVSGWTHLLRLIRWQ